jgi:hypothetical protein
MAAEKTASALKLEYGKGHWWGSTIQSYARMKLLLKGQGLEQNHLVHAAFFRKGPHRLRELVAYVPCLTLSMQEHRGEKYSYHKMKDGQRVGTETDAFDGCGMDAFLESRGINVNAKSFSTSEIKNAIDVSIEYWHMIGIHHAAAALREFKTLVFEPLARGVNQ